MKTETLKPSNFKITRKTLDSLWRDSEMLRSSGDFQYGMAGDKEAAQELYDQADAKKAQWRVDYDAWKNKSKK